VKAAPANNPKTFRFTKPIEIPKFKSNNNEKETEMKEIELAKRIQKILEDLWC
jgi:hypothetical protein